MLKIVSVCECTKYTHTHKIDYDAPFSHIFTSEVCVCVRERALSHSLFIGGREPVTISRSTRLPITEPPEWNK